MGNSERFRSTLSPRHLRLALAHQPRLLAAFQAMAHEILFGGELPEREREIAIIRTGALTRSEYEWGMHVSIYAERCGLTREQIEALTSEGVAPGVFSEREQTIVRAVDELHRAAGPLLNDGGTIPAAAASQHRRS